MVTKLSEDINKNMDCPLVIIPCAGKSSRFPDVKPKYLLYDYTGKLMVHSVAESYPSRYPIFCAMLKEHDDKFDASRHVTKNSYINGIVLSSETNGPAHTVYETLLTMEAIGVNINRSIVVRDCDSFFKHDIPVFNNNFVGTVDINQNNFSQNVSKKSFVRLNDQNQILSIVEKQIVSSTFCAGVYGFESGQVFIETYKKLEKMFPAGHEIYVSHVIHEMLNAGFVFNNVPITDYVDVGTLSDWNEYNDKPTIFCDIDGTIIKAQSRVGDNSYLSEPIFLENNIKIIKDYYDSGSQVIFTTHRHINDISLIKKKLLDYGFGIYGNDVIIITSLHNSKRILINDYTSHAPYPRAESINIPRDSDTLPSILKKPIK